MGIKTTIKCPFPHLFVKLTSKAKKAAVNKNRTKTTVCHRASSCTLSVKDLPTNMDLENSVINWEAHI